jgi:ribosomal-protein-alanine N-acetyltransferase
MTNDKVQYNALTSPNLTLRGIKESDFNFFFRLLNDPRIAEFNPVKSYNEKEIQAFMKWHLAHYGDLGFGIWVVEHNDSKELIGYVGPEKSTYDAPFTPCVECLWYVFPDFWETGYAFEAATMVLDHCFSDLKFEKVIVRIHPKNLRSLGMAKKLGFKRIQGMEHRQEVDGQTVMFQVFELKDWKIPQQSGVEPLWNDYDDE